MHEQSDARATAASQRDHTPNSKRVWPMRLVVSVLDMAVVLSLYSKVSESVIKLKCHRNARQKALQIDIESGAGSRCGSEFARLDPSYVEKKQNLFIKSALECARDIIQKPTDRAE